MWMTLALNLTSMLYLTEKGARWESTECVGCHRKDTASDIRDCLLVLLQELASVILNCVLVLLIPSVLV